jgi:peroxidase
MQAYQRGTVVLVIAFATVMGFTTTSTAQVPPDEFRTLDGMLNNVHNPTWGSAGIQLLRISRADYADGVSEPAGMTRKSPREISNILAAQLESILNHGGASDFIWQWGQFLDHDLDLTTQATPEEPLAIAVPVGDPYFDPDFTGNQTIRFNRSIYDSNTGTSPKNPRQQLNLITSFIDASNVYGSDEVRARALRTNDGTGKLQTTSGGQFLPFNTAGLPNAGGDDKAALFLAGDIRANEQIALTAMHTLFVREHNWLCDEIQQAEPGLNGEEIYQQARKIIGAQMQVVTYNEFLPILLGRGALPPYKGYNPKVNPAIANEFSTAAFRFGHSMLSPTLLRINMPGYELVPTALKDAFFNPRLIHRGGGIEPILRGLATQPAQEMDNQIVDGVRNFLFGEPGQGGFDLAALNIQRGRDHGLADYNTVGKAYGLRPVKKFSDITADPGLQAALQAVYESVDEIDLWVGGLAEDYVPGALVGATFHAILVDQFTRLRDGDRFWFQNDRFFTGAQLTEIENTTLADIIRRNTLIGEEIPDSVFLVGN